MSEDHSNCAGQDEPLKERVVEVLDWIRPALQGDGGDIELVDIDDQGVVYIRLLGACAGCPSRNMTLSMGVERNLKEKVPEVSKVVCV